MIWNFCFILSIIIMTFAVFRTFNVARHYQSNRILTPFQTIFAGVFLAIFTGLVPLFTEMLEKEVGFIPKLIIYDFLQTVQVFTLEVNGEFILDNINRSATIISDAYSTYMAFLFFAAPVLTFGFIASLFKNVLAEVAYNLHFSEDIYAFSCLDEKSLNLARSIKNNHKNALIIFTNADQGGGDAERDYSESVKQLKAIVLHKDILTVNFMRHSNKSQLTFLMISENESDNILNSLKLIEKYKDRENTHIFVFSTEPEGEVLLANAQKGKIKVRRVNEIRSLIYHFLYDEGECLFDSAIEKPGEKKTINAVIIGLGRFGTEMLKALTWYCQMDGYAINIFGFDLDDHAKDKISAQCPELMSEKYNGVHISGESDYSIRIFSGIDVRTRSFSEIYQTIIPDATFVFISLGNDTDNINQAVNMRMLSERAGSNPLIKTIVNSSEKRNALTGITNFKGKEYRIDAIGDLESSFSEEVLLGSELEQLALNSHLKWGKEEEFWQYEYNYRSSMASAIHMKARIACGIPGADKKGENLTLEERDIIEILEHKRWNAYMRSEGYIYSGSKDSTSRNDLAKMHHDLVDFSSLTEEEKRKDSNVGTY